ncbi:sensor histidine kinase [Actinoplanes subtropicus]|uniref:sensor histidine kinase n=1 Tax=Actinoplanes subtropicus TaxID=543632 RepID=UPI0004C3D42A|nr:PAS domain S-box protein [Actinoplanes subtropicus]
MGVGWRWQARWRFLAAPLVIWLVLTSGGATALRWAQQRGRAGLMQRFEVRLDLLGDFVGSYVADLIDRERAQAVALLADPVVTQRDFARSVAGFGYPAAVLLDSRGRLLHAVPADASQTGQDLTGRYPHLRTAVLQGRPAVSQVVPSVVRREPVVAFAVPYETTSGRRVFSGAVAITHSPLSSYLASAWSLVGIRVQLADTGGAIAASNGAVDSARPLLADGDPDLARALARRAVGRYRAGGRWWRYASLPIPGVPWRLSATVPEDVLFASVHGNETAGRVAVATAAGVGLLVVAAAARSRRHRCELLASEQRFRKVFDHSRIGMIISNPRGTFIRVNPAFGRMLGRPPDELVGMHFADITHPDDAEAGLDILADCLSGRLESFELEKRYRHADGHTVEVVVTSAMLRDESGRPQFFATQIVDMTERHALERARDRQQAELAEHADQLERTNAQMADFIAMLSHDVRQPLTGVVARGDLLLEEWPELPETERIRYVRQMTAAGHRADHLVGEILMLAQLDAGAIVARPRRVDVPHAVLEAVAGHGPSPDHPIGVLAPDRTIAFADPAHLRLILGNLLGNALKYGAPPVTVSVVNRPAHVEIHVADSGEGVPDEFVPHLFERFTRADSGVALTKAGTGIGLYLVRQLADAGGISITYRATSPHGATFVLTLPQAAHPGAAVETRPLNARGA